MKILIVYYSKTGNTERVAKQLAHRLDADLEKLVDQKNRFGFWGYVWGGRDAMKKRLTILEETQKNPTNYDLIVLGMPVWGWNLVPAMRTYLEENKDKIDKYSFFVTSGNTPVEKLKKHFVEILDQEPQKMVGFSEKELKDLKVYQQKIEDFMV